MDRSESLPRVLVIGKESVGKSQLVASLTGRWAASYNFPGSTVACDCYADEFYNYIDTPGLLRRSDSDACRETLAALAENERVLLVVNATHIDQDLEDLLGLVEDKHGAVVVTFWDKVVRIPGAGERLAELSRRAAIPIIPVDARQLSETHREGIRRAVGERRKFPLPPLSQRAGWTVEPSRTPFDTPVIGQVLALALLILPAWFAAQYANALADRLFGPLNALIAPLLRAVEGWPGPLAAIFGNDYGFVAMLPFLLLYSVPTVLFFAVIIGLLKSSGLVDRMTVSLHPLMRPFGLAGRDLVRVMMGFGCNVPAVVNTRACSSCSRANCVTAIGIGAACSYQLPATVSVLAAADMAYLVAPYLLFLAVTTLGLLTLSASSDSRDPRNHLLIEGRAFLQWPQWRAIRREAAHVVNQFFTVALPVFFMICVLAALLSWSGALDAGSRLMGPVMSLFNLPPETSLAVILGSIRKDGLAIGLLNMEAGILKVPLESPVQVLTAVALAGIFLPCLVTVLAIARELGWRFAVRMMARQATAAVLSCLVLAWGGSLLYS